MKAIRFLSEINLKFMLRIASKGPLCHMPTAYDKTHSEEPTLRCISTTSSASINGRQSSGSYHAAAQSYLGLRCSHMA